MTDALELRPYGKEECGHPSVTRFSSEDRRARLWACDDCKRRFYPACPICVDVGHRGESHPILQESKAADD